MKFPAYSTEPERPPVVTRKRQRCRLKEVRVPVVRSDRQNGPDPYHERQDSDVCLWNQDAGLRVAPISDGKRLRTAGVPVDAGLSAASEYSKGANRVNNEIIHDLASQLVEQVTARVLASQVPAIPDQRKIEPRLLTVEQAAEYIGRSEQAVRHLIFQRDIPVVRTGRCVRIDRKDLDRWIENCKA